MIKFKPKRQNKNTGTVQYMFDNIGAIASSKIVNQLNERKDIIRCELHPDIDSIVLVDMDKTLTLEIESVCCETFRPTLERFVQVQLQ